MRRPSWRARSASAFNASGATEPGESLARKADKQPVVAVPPSLDGDVLHGQRPGAALLHRAVLAARLRELHARRCHAGEPCGRSGTARPTRAFARRCTRMRRRSPAPAAACAGASRVPSDEHGAAPQRQRHHPVPQRGGRHRSLRGGRARARGGRGHRRRRAVRRSDGGAGGSGRREGRGRARARLRPSHAFGTGCAGTDQHHRSLHRRRRQRPARHDPRRAGSRSRAGAPISCSARVCGASASRAASAHRRSLPATWPDCSSASSTASASRTCRRSGPSAATCSIGWAWRRRTFGWNLEMQMRVAAAGLRAVEVPVGQRRRAGGVSKVSGDWRSAARAAWVLVRSFCRLAWQLRRKQIPTGRALGRKRR